MRNRMQNLMKLFKGIGGGVLFVSGVATVFAGIAFTIFGGFITLERIIGHDDPGTVLVLGLIWLGGHDGFLVRGDGSPPRDP